MSGPATAAIDTQRARWRAAGQDHVWAFWDRLDNDQRERLQQQLERLEPGLDALLEAERRATRDRRPDASRQLEPVDVIELPENGGDPKFRAEAGSLGETVLVAGRVAAFVVAGGQGTRLGFPGPKGAFPVGPITDRCLFELHAQKLAGRARRSGVRIPWYIMTSPATDAETRRLFERSSYFGLPREDVFIFSQGMLPAFDFDGRMLLASPDRVFESPDGHGGALTSLETSGALADMERRGIDTIFYYQVDNPLVRICDPVFLGLHHRNRAEMSCKVIRKVDPDAKWGVLARVDGQVGVVEYTELDDAHRHARDNDGKLRFWAGNPALHVLDRDFVGRVARDASRLLPLHASAKKIPGIDAQGLPLDPAEPNGYKLERFVFDALPVAQRVSILETCAADEFSPIKNAQGSESPESARRDLVATYKSWLEAAGFELPGPDCLVEIDHSRIDGVDDLAGLRLDRLSDAADLIRVTTRAPA